MNHSNEDPRLDEAIDSLLKANPLKAPDSLKARIMATVEREATRPMEASTHRKAGGNLWAYALPVAAVLTLAALLWPSLKSPQATPDLTYEEAREIIELEASLRALAPLQSEGDFSTQGLLVTLETATYAL